MQIEYRETKKLTPYAQNTKRHDQKQVENVANSIKRFGWQQPIVIDDNGVVVIGHCRLLAAKRLGLKEVPVTVASGLTEEEIRELRITDNKTNESPWDLEMLKVELDDLSFDGFDFDLNAEIVEASAGKSVKEDDYEVIIPEEPKVKLGDVYQLGNHRLMCGDSTLLSDVVILMGENRADALVTDPPYNVSYEGGTKEKLTIVNDNMKDGAFRAFLVEAFKNANNAMKEGAAFYVWHADSEGYNFRGACRDAGWDVRQCLVWVKSSLVLGRQDYQWKHEPCLYGWKNGAAHFWSGGRKERTTITGFDLYELRNMTKEELLRFIEEQWCDKEDVETTVLYEEKPSKNAEHPTMKPVKLIARQIRNSTNEHDIVLDLFGGSGTTLIACEQLNRRCFTMEFDPKYANVIIDRWEKFTGNKAVLLNG